MCDGGHILLSGARRNFAKFIGEPHGALSGLASAPPGGSRRCLHEQRGRHGSIYLAIDGAEGLQPQRFLTVLRCGRNRGWIQPGRCGPSCVSVREAGEASGGLAAFSGVHLLQRVIPEGVASRGSGCVAGRAFAQLHRDSAGGGGFQAEKCLQRHHPRPQRQVHCARRGRGTNRRRRGVLHDRRQDRGIDPADRGQGCRGDSGVGQLRLQRVRPGSQAEPDRSALQSTSWWTNP